MKITEWLVEAFFTIKLFLSPTLIGGTIGAYIYLTATTTTQEYLSYAIAGSGVLIGIILAWKIKKKKAATEFFGELISTPDIGSKKKTNQ